MKELVVVSGKGGTGKTSVSAAIAFLSRQKILVDCDVDAANFHLISSASIREKYDFFAGFDPHIDETACVGCGICTELCRFKAIEKGVIIKPFQCEGCGVCAFHCPHHAIQMKEKQAGQWFVSQTRFGALIHAELGLSVENSGKLVSKVRQEAKKIAAKQSLPLVLTDGPPGIGCPAIAALSGASMALAVVEPSESGVHDLKRLVQLVAHFKLPLCVCINKSTLHLENTQKIISWCQTKGISVAGKLPYSDGFRYAVQEGKTILEIPGYEEEKEAVKNLWNNVVKELRLSFGEGKLSYVKEKVQALF